MSTVVVPKGPLRGYAFFVEHVASSGGPGWDLIAILAIATTVVAVAQLIR